MQSSNPARVTTIREATVDDIQTVIELNRAGIHSWASNFLPAMQEWIDSVCNSPYFQEMIANPEKVLLVAEIDDEICGTAYGYPKGRQFYVGGLYLSVNGQGLATKLLLELIQHARTFGLTELMCEVYEDNRKALQFFHRKGWTLKNTEKYKGINFYSKVLLLA